MQKPVFIMRTSIGTKGHGKREDPGQNLKSEQRKIRHGLGLSSAQIMRVRAGNGTIACF